MTHFMTHLEYKTITYLKRVPLHKNLIAGCELISTTFNNSYDNPDKTQAGLL